MNHRDTQALDYWSADPQVTIKTLGSSPQGLSPQEAQRRLAQEGPNALVATGRAPAWRLFLRQFESPLVLILVFAAFVSAFLRDWTDAAVILTIVLASAIITFTQEHMASNAVEQLRSRVRHEVDALRGGQVLRIPAESIVRGDVVLLSAGSLVPADGLLLETKDLFVNQAVLTGETFPVEKEAGKAAPDATLAERANCVFMGTTVRSGTGRMLVAATGRSTAFGQIADKLNLSPPETEFERGIRHFGLMLSQVMVILVLIVFGMNIVSAKPPVDALLFAIALAVGISPELLPAIITINLSKGAQTMARHGVIVRRLNAIENFGSMDILCTDKTGTLTAGVVQLEQAVDAAGQASAAVYRFAYLNAALQTGMANALDEAIVRKQEEASTGTQRVDLSQVEKLDEVPYDFTRKRLSVIVQAQPQGEVLLISKGALEPLLALCTRYVAGSANAADPLGEQKGLDEQARKAIFERYTQWSDQGLRVLGVAYRALPAQDRYTREDERDLVFSGYLLFLDPPKEGARAAIAALASLGVALKIITGDNRRVAEHTAHLVGLPAGSVVTGADLARMSDEALLHAVEQANLFAEVDPNEKQRIIHALQRRSHVVGYMGDGINDAPALHDADVGISVQGAVDVAREAADFVLLEQDLDVLRQGIEEGRVTFANSLKYVYITTSANFGNMFSMAGVSLFIPFLPLLAKQILLNNFLSDVPALAIAGDNVDRELVDRPYRWDIHFIRRFMIVFGLVSSLFDYVTFGILLFAAHATPVQFRTAWFVESLLTELVAMLVVRTRRPFYRSRPGTWLTIGSMIVAGIAFWLPYSPLARAMEFVPLTGLWMLVILMIAAAYVVALEITKHFFYAHAARHQSTRSSLGRIGGSGGTPPSTGNQRAARATMSSTPRPNA